MKKLALLAGLGLLAFGTVDSAQAQRWDRDGARWRHHHHGGIGTGGALAAGFVGGAVLGGLATAATAPAYGYGYGSPYGYGAAYPTYGYGYGTTYGAAYPVSYGAGYPVAGDYAAPTYKTRIVYRQPSVNTRVVYRDAPTVRRTRVVYRQAPVVRQREVYQQPRARVVYGQPGYNTRVTYQQSQRDRVIVRNTVRRDAISTGSVGDRREMRMQRRMMRD